VGFEENSKDRLINQIGKKLQTTMIGALAGFENEFGYLWGHGLPYGQLTQDQKECRKVWNCVRTKILDDGNSNLRAIKSEISQYDIKWKRFVTNFNVKQEKNRDV